MIALTPNLFRRLQSALLRCQQFESQQTLKAIFIDKRISAWRNEIPVSTTRVSLVLETIGWLIQKQSSTMKKNALVLLLCVLSDQIATEDELHHELITLAQELEQELSSGKRKSSASIFICYRRIEPDQHLAYSLHDRLTALGYEVFIDIKMRAGVEWLETIDKCIESSSLFIPLLSENSVNSEMVRAEIRRAYEYRSLLGHPYTLPIRIRYQEPLLPYAIHAYISSLQYVAWNNDSDTDGVLQQILAALDGNLPKQQPDPKWDNNRVNFGEDGQVFTQAQSVYPPSPEFDPRVLESIHLPGGTLKLSDKLYVRRQADSILEGQIVGQGTITTVRASRQTGKSSLLIRALDYAEKHGVQPIYLDLQIVDGHYLESAENFLRYLAEFLTSKIPDAEEVERVWKGPLGPQDKLSSIVNQILAKTEKKLVIALDEADRLLEKSFYDSFFSLLRHWHNRAAYDSLWEKLNLVLVISTEPYLLIRDLQQSPFNVGLGIYLTDFDNAQIHDLNKRHGNPLQEQYEPELLTLLGGHPYLSRKAFYILTTQQLTWDELKEQASDNQGVFGDHLRYYHWLLYDKPELQNALKEIMARHACPDEFLFHRLLRAGIVKGNHNHCMWRCELYKQYFEGKLS